jgi:hypothetical protein
VLKTFGQKAVLPAWRDFEGTGDMLGRDAFLAAVLNGRKPVLEGFMLPGGPLLPFNPAISFSPTWQDSFSIAVRYGKVVAK